MYVSTHVQGIIIFEMLLFPNGSMLLIVTNYMAGLDFQIGNVWFLIISLVCGVCVSGVGRYSSKGVHYYQIAREARAKNSTTPTFDRKLHPFCIDEVAG